MIHLGAIGLGRAFSLMAPAFAADPRVKLVAGADRQAEARDTFGGRAYASAEELCADREVDAVYIATPHPLHAEHACLALAAGKHVLVEKPMALSMRECARMIEAARKAKRALIVGHSHSFDAPIALARKLIGKFGPLRMITALDFTDYLYRPRRPDELDTSKGGGAVFNQAAHQVDIARLLAGTPARWVRATTQAWDSARPTEGAYQCLVGFDGATAALTYSGYAHFDSDELMGWIGELGQRKDPAAPWGQRYKPCGDELHQHFGLVIASCEKADLRPTAEGVMVYSGEEKHLERLPAPRVPRVEVIDELHAAVVQGKPALHDGAWGAATLEVCLAILRSSREGKEIRLTSRTA
jgi:phthalate 4,5-cis-dihydrodiol dehydrogenase